MWDIGETHLPDDFRLEWARGMTQEQLGPSWGYNEAQLREFWDEWASTAQEWTETDWCYWLFVRKFGAEKAMAATDKALAEERERSMVETLARYGIRNVRDPYLRGQSQEDRVRLIRTAGLEPVGAQAAG
jgi:hypothetical protein